MLVRRSFSLDTERDSDLLAWLDGQANVSEAIRTALRAYSSAPEITLEVVYEAVKTLEARLSSGEVGVGNQTGERLSAEDPDLAAQLDRLGL